MSVLVTGGTGCLGHHLLSVFTRAKGELISYSQHLSKPFRSLNHVKYYQGDLLDYKALSDVISEHKPEEIYHLAAQNSVGLSQKKPYLTLETNILGTQNLFECIRKIVPKTRVVFVSSSEVYGGGKGNMDIVHPESDPVIPLTPFATSKAAGELLALQYSKSNQLDVVIARPFHFTGPLQSINYVLPSVASQIADIELNDGELSIYAGNLDISRDYVDVRDLARGIVLLMNSAKNGEIYNICSGKALTIRDHINYLIRLSKKPIEIHINPNLERPIDIPMLVGSPEKIMNLTGWKPIISIEDSLKDLYAEIKIRIQKDK